MFPSSRSNILATRFVCLLALAPGSMAAAANAEGLSFNKDIRQIFADNCFQCHGPDKGTREADLRIDLREAALEGVEGRPTIVPGSPEKSEMYRRITARDDDLMPPRESGKSLKPEQIEMIRQWIADGAEYEPHWSYIPPERKEPPQVEKKDWGRNPVDGFVLARLERRGLAPMPEADQHTLLRRLSFDLRGLPPSTAELEEFLNDQEPGAYERLVDRLLASPHYGERMAVYWLDLVRFADTVGYHGDQNSQVAPYRDYVINSFNQNKPFDQFTREQIAGDLLPNPTREQRVATAYNRLNMVTREGGAQAKEYLAKYASDRVRTTSTVWMGSTVGCAECHDHKFDPFTAKDFYSFAAFFADVKEEGVYSSGGGHGDFPPVLRLPDDEQAAQLDEFDRLMAEVEKATAPADATVAKVRAGETALPVAKEIIADHLETEPAAFEALHSEWLQRFEGIVNEGEAMEVPVIFGDDGGAAKELHAWEPGEKDGRRARVQAGTAGVGHAAHEFDPPEAPRAGDSVYAWVYLDAENPPSAVMLEVSSLEKTRRAWWGDEAIIADTAALPEKRMGDLPAAGSWVRLEVPAADVDLGEKSPLRGIAFVQQGGRAWWGSAGFLGEHRDIPKPLVATLKKPADERSEAEQRDLLAYHFASMELGGSVKRQNSLKQRKRAFQMTLPSVVVTEAVEPRVVRVLNRGDWMDESGEIVEPAVPHFLPQPTVGDDRRLTRLDLANWFVSPENPLTARAMANRFWMLFFGTGVSNTVDELGNRGEWPANQELLDWLAVEFVESGWDVKHMVRLLVTSSAYRVSSQAPPPLRDVDPNNRLHARQARPRLAAEFVRDNALAVSGLLVRNIGGPSARPYQPEGYYRELNFPKRDYEPSAGEEQYRRGVYTHWQRTFLHPALMAFDAPSRDECVAQRPYSNTPLQALTLLNDPSYVEAARAFAARILTESSAPDDAARIAWAWRETLSRTPTETESAALAGLLESARAEYKENPDAAKKLATVGQFQWPADFDASELAAWTAVTRTILNLQEAFVRY